MSDKRDPTKHRRETSEAASDINSVLEAGGSRKGEKGGAAKRLGWRREEKGWG